MADVFSMSDTNLTTAGTMAGLQVHSSSSLPSNLQSTDQDVVRSRRPLILSQSEASALDDILRDKSLAYGSSTLLVGKSYESGFFSDSPGGSKLSLYQMAEVQKAKLNDSGLPEQHELDQFNKEGLEPLFKEIAEELGGCWKETGRYLLKKVCSVENIDVDYSKVSEKAYQILRRWKEENGGNASVTQLFKCFNHIGKEDVAEKVLQYLPDPIANACEMILLSSPKKIRCPSMITIIHNTEEMFKDLKVEKQLIIADEEGELEVYLCESKITRKKYIIKEIEEKPRNYILAARLAIPEKLFIMQKRKLRKTTDFVKEIKFKEETVVRLIKIVEQLQAKLKIDYSFCKEELDCSNCEKTKTKQELLEKDLSILHYALEKMMSGNRRLSVSGIPTERIYELADRTYGICEDHEKMHSEMKEIKRRCSKEFLDVEVRVEETDVADDSDIEDPLKCTLNILQHLARKRKVVQSLVIKKRKESKAVQRNKSDKSKSRFYVPVYRQSFLYKRGDRAQATPERLTRKDSKKSKRSFKSKNPKEKVMTRKSACFERPVDTQSFHPRANTSPASLVCGNGSKTDFVGPEDLDLDDIDDPLPKVLPYRVNSLKVNGKSSPKGRTFEQKTITSVHKKVHKCNSDPYAKSHNTLYQERDSHSEGVLDILTREYYNERVRSLSDAHVTRYKKPGHKHDRFENLTKARKESQERDQSLSKSQSDALEVSGGNRTSQKRDKVYGKSKSNHLEASEGNKTSQEPDKVYGKSQSYVLKASGSNKTSQKRDQVYGKLKSDALEASGSNKTNQKSDKACGKSQTDILEASSISKPIQKRVHVSCKRQPESPNPKSEAISASDKNNNKAKLASDRDVKWLNDIDTENIILV